MRQHMASSTSFGAPQPSDSGGGGLCTTMRYQQFKEFVVLCAFAPLRENAVAVPRVIRPFYYGFAGVSDAYGAQSGSPITTSFQRAQREAM